MSSVFLCNVLLTSALLPAQAPDAGKYSRITVALGAASGLPTDANGVVTPRKGPYPLGIAFKLVTNPTPADRLHPREARDNVATYLAPKER